MELAGIAGMLAASAAAVVLAGTALARAGDVIAARTRLGGLWVGSVFLAVATSLPELTTDVSAVRMGVPDLAAGDLFGSSMANMLILALVSLLPGAELFRRAALDNALLISLAILLTALAAVGVALHPSATVLGVGYGSLLILVVYVAGTRILFSQSRVLAEAGRETELLGAPRGDAAAAPPTPEGESAPPLRRAVLTFVAAAAVVLLAGPAFAGSAAALAEATGMDAGFVGTWLVGFATSLPELVTSVAAVRMGAYDLAVGNLYGSNAVNMLLLVPLDLAHTGGPILGGVGQAHVVSALAAIALMSIGLAAVVRRARGRVVLEPGGALMVAAYFAGLAAVWAASGG